MHASQAGSCRYNHSHTVSAIPSELVTTSCQQNTMCLELYPPHVPLAHQMFPLCTCAKLSLSTVQLSNMVGFDIWSPPHEFPETTFFNNKWSKQIHYILMCVSSCNNTSMNFNEGRHCLKHHQFVTFKRIVVVKSLVRPMGPDTCLWTLPVTPKSSTFATCQLHLMLSPTLGYSQRLKFSFNKFSKSFVIF